MIGPFFGYSRYSPPPGLDVVLAGHRLAVELTQGEFDEGLWRSILSLLGPLFRIPSTQIDKTVRGAFDIKEGETENPTVLLTGPRRDEQ